MSRKPRIHYPGASYQNDLLMWEAKMRKSAAVLILTLATSNAGAVTNIYRDRDAFAKASEPNVIVKLTDVADQTPTPFTSEGVLFTQGLVQSEAVGLPQSFWFPGVDSSPEFIVGPLLVATFPSDVNATGVDFTCFACDGTPNDASMNWTLLSSSGSIVDAGSTAYDFSSWNYSYTPFLGITSETPFHTIVLSRTNISNGGIPNWFAYHLRYTPILPSKTLLLPAAVRGHGLMGTYFTTDVWLSNGYNSTLTLRADFLRAGGYDNTTPAETKTLILGPHETRVVTDIIGTLFSLSDQYGPVRFTASGEGADQLVVGSRTSATLGGGQRSTYGFSVEAREVDISDTSPLHLIGLPQNAAYRTNIGIINLSASDADFTLTLIDSVGNVLGTSDGVLPPFGATQSSLISLFQTALGLKPSYDGLAVMVSSKNGSALAAYATPVDNNTGDGTFIYGLHAAEGTTSGTDYLPAVTRVNGMFGTRMSSRLAVRNVDAQQSVTLSFSLRAPNSGNRGSTPVTRTINPGATLVVSNVIQNLFGLKTGEYGAFRVDWTSSGGIAPVFSSQFI
jgi:hypothetical protein